MAPTTSSYIFECPCGSKVKTQTPKVTTSCPSCGRGWKVDWDYEVVKAKGAGK